jgi:hypothetical protein
VNMRYYAIRFITYLYREVVIELYTKLSFICLDLVPTFIILSSAGSCLQDIL